MSAGNPTPHEPAALMRRYNSCYSQPRKCLHPLEVIRTRNFIDNITPWDLTKCRSPKEDPKVTTISFRKHGKVRSAHVVSVNSFSSESE